MADEKEYLRIPGHVSVKEAAEILGVSYDRVHQLIRAKRLSARMVSYRLMIPLDELEQFRRNPTGRLRSKPPEWRTYHDSNVLTTDIHVQVRPAQQDRLLERLKTLQEENRHTFPGTIARYVLKDRGAFTSIHIWLVWKDVEMPDEGAREEDLAAFKAALADVLDWETAEYSTKEGIIYT